ncbi:MAG TPA: hypothetical protein VN622_17315 [Clostridia bacterium]|nr:hypothetical protein [Clostridia bacterium]
MSRHLSLCSAGSLAFGTQLTVDTCVDNADLTFVTIGGSTTNHWSHPATKNNAHIENSDAIVSVGTELKTYK